MKEKWFTLAVSNVGTHKMQFRKEMTKEEAIILGEEYCRDHKLAYAGTFSEEEINNKEKKLRKVLYEEEGNKNG